jgi:Ni,Fe-hydrogenase maturation factor
LSGSGIKRILVFGNPVVKKDSIPLEIIRDLREKFPEVEFVPFDPNENLEAEGGDLRIIDTVEGIKKVTLITDIDSISTQRIYSMHDFDLGYNLKLLKKLGYVNKVRIFGVPMKISKRDAVSQLTKIISANLS